MPAITSSSIREESSHVAIFIDLENLTNGLGYRADGCDIDFAKTFHMVGGKRALTVAAAYAGIPLDQPVGSIVRDLRQLNVELRDVPGHRWKKSDEAIPDRTMKDAADFQIYADAISVAVARPDIDTFIIMSNDNGFYALANKLKELGKTVVTAIRKGSGLSKVYWNRVDRVLFLPLVDASDDSDIADETATPKQTSQRPSEFVKAPTNPGNAQESTGILNEISAIPQIEETYTSATKWDYCTQVTNLFSGPLGAIIQAHDSDGLSWGDARAAITHLIPHATAKDVGFKNWMTMLRFALPHDYDIVPTDHTGDYRIIPSSDLQGREAEGHLTLDDLGNPPELNKAINFMAPLDKISFVIEWCAQASEAFTPSDCYSFLEDNLGRSGLDSTDIDRSMRVLAYLDLLTLVEEKSSPLSGQLIARGANIKTGTTELTPTRVQYEKSPSFSEVSALEAVIETVTSRAAEANWPLGSKTQAALGDMRDRIDYLRENSDPRIIGRGISSHKSATNRHTWDSLPLL